MLKELRESRGLTQRELAKQLNIGFSTLGMYETGKRQPNNDTLQAFADYFGVTVDKILGRDEVPKEPKPKKMPKDLLKIIEQEDFTLNGRMATPEDRERLIKMYEVMYWDAKEKNKRKK